MLHVWATELLQSDGRSVLWLPDVADLACCLRAALQVLLKLVVWGC